MRDERTTMSLLNASLLPDGPNSLDRFLRGDWTLEVGGIRCELAHESHQAIHLLWRGWIKCVSPLLVLGRPRQSFGNRDKYVPFA